MALESKHIGIVVKLLVLGADPLTQNGREMPPSDYATPLCRMFLRFFNLRRQSEVKVEKSKPRERFLQLLNAQLSTHAAAGQDGSFVDLCRR